MEVVVADTTPLRYLAEIDHLELLRRLFGTVSIPAVVYRELQHDSTTAHVRTRLTGPPSWLKVDVMEIAANNLVFPALDAGERAALLLGLRLKTDLILIDDRKGAAAARQEGLKNTGTLGVLVLAARRNLVDLADAFTLLRRTGFRCSKSMMNDLLAEEEEKRHS